MARSNTFAHVESLEHRRLLTVVPVSGTDGNDVIHIGVRPDNPLSYFIDVNGVRTAADTFDPSDVDKAFTVTCLGGDDLFTIDPAFPGKVLVSGGEGNDTISGSNGHDTLLGNGGLDVLLGPKGGDRLVGGAGADTLKGGLSDDDLYGDGDSSGQRGFDGTVKTAGDQLFGDEGRDRLFASGGHDLLRGGNDADKLNGGDGDDLMFGDGGEDELYLARTAHQDGAIGGGGNDLLDGGPGTFDRLLLESADLPVHVSFDGVANDGFAGEAVNVLPTFERVESGALAGGSVIDLSAAPAGVDVGLEGIGPGAAAAHVTILGTPFADTFSLNGRNGVNSVRLHVEGGGGDDRIHGGFLNDTIIGGAGHDSIWGFAGDDTILDDAGNDTIEGGSGNDRIASGGGDDVCYGDDFSLVGFEVGRDTIEGGVGHDKVFGGGGADRLFGNGGRDTVDGEGGKDQLFGGPTDADLIFGGRGTDSAADDVQDIYDGVETLLV